MRIFDSREWRILQLNAENLFIKLDHPPAQPVGELSEDEWSKLSVATVPNKPLWQLKDLASSIEQINPEFIVLCEVGGIESLASFSTLFLENRYEPFLIEGNSDRGIDIGFLVKRHLPFKYDLISHRNRPLKLELPHETQSIKEGIASAVKHRFSRDVLELHVFENDEMVLNLFGVHLKSPLDRDRIDPGGKDRRRAELEALVEIYEEFRSSNPQVATVVCGDFNGVALGPGQEAEFRELNRTDLMCCLEVAKNPMEQRFTWSTFPVRSHASYRQIDWILISAELQARVDHRQTRVYRYLDRFGMPVNRPNSLAEKKLLPSDHYPTVLTLRQLDD